MEITRGSRIALALLLGACAGGEEASPEPNTPPIADAGLDLDGVTGIAVQLDGSGSDDADGDTLAFSWTFDGVPDLSTATLQDADSSAARFVPDVRGTYVVRLTVDDGAATAEDTVTVVVAQACRNYSVGGEIDPVRECVVSGELCYPDAPESNVGYCAAGDGCGFADQTGCAGTETCHPAGILSLDNTNATLCLAAGAGGQMAACWTMYDCAPGYMCIYEGGSGTTVCLRYCDPSGAACPGGRTCYDLAASLPSAVRPSFGVGACL